MQDSDVFVQKIGKKGFASYAFVAPPAVAEGAQGDRPKHAELFIRLRAFESILLIKQQKKHLMFSRNVMKRDCQLLEHPRSCK